MSLKTETGSQISARTLADLYLNFFTDFLTNVGSLIIYQKSFCGFLSKLFSGIFKFIKKICICRFSQTIVENWKQLLSKSLEQKNMREKKLSRNFAKSKSRSQISARFLYFCICRFSQTVVENWEKKLVSKSSEQKNIREKKIE